MQLDGYTSPTRCFASGTLARCSQLPALRPVAALASRCLWCVRLAVLPDFPVPALQHQRPDKGRGGRALL
eukprot:3502568-Alexandrium_andersonii.AAC.1